MGLVRRKKAKGSTTQVANRPAVTLAMATLKKAAKTVHVSKPKKKKEATRDVRRRAGQAVKRAEMLREFHKKMMTHMGSDNAAMISNARMMLKATWSDDVPMEEMRSNNERREKKVSTMQKTGNMLLDVEQKIRGGASVADVKNELLKALVGARNALASSSDMVMKANADVLAMIEGHQTFRAQAARAGWDYAEGYGKFLPHNEMQMTMNNIGGHLTQAIK